MMIRPTDEKIRKESPAVMNFFRAVFRGVVTQLETAPSSIGAEQLVDQAYKEQYGLIFGRGTSSEDNTAVTILGQAMGLEASFSSPAGAAIFAQGPAELKRAILGLGEKLNALPMSDADRDKAQTAFATAMQAERGNGARIGEKS